MTLCEFETERLQLRRWQDRFEAEILAMNADPEVMRFIGDGSALAPDTAAAKTALERQRAGMQRQDGLGLWAIQNKEDGRFLGWAALFELAHTGPDIEIGYRLNKAAWGKGYASEAAACLLPHGFSILALAEIRAVTYPENRASRRVLEKLGFRDCGICDYAGISATDYRLSNSDWRARQT